MSMSRGSSSRVSELKGPLILLVVAALSVANTGSLPDSLTGSPNNWLQFPIELSVTFHGFLSIASLVYGDGFVVGS